LAADGINKIGRQVDDGGGGDATGVSSLELPGGLAGVRIENEIAHPAPGEERHWRGGHAHAETRSRRCEDLGLHTLVEKQPRQRGLGVGAQIQHLDPLSGGKLESRGGRDGGDAETVFKKTTLEYRALEPGEKQEVVLGLVALDPHGSGRPAVGVDGKALPVVAQRVERVASGVLDLDGRLNEAGGDGGPDWHDAEESGELAIGGVPEVEVAEGQPGQDARRLVVTLLGGR